MELFVCPVCSMPLNRFSGALKCAGDHSFDIAREGYVNLLLAQYRRSRMPGDSAEMITARRRFLTANHYQPLKDALEQTITAADLTSPIVDLGCGEGYFTSAFAEHFPAVYGLDISKVAVRAACSRSKSMNLAVASTARLPLADASFGAATILMAPFSDDVARVLVQQGMLIRVTAAPDHLRAMKHILYPHIRPYTRAETDLASFRLLESRRISFEIQLDRQSRTDLIGMTPMRFRTSRSLQLEASFPEQLSTSCDFWIDVFERI